MVLMRPVTRTKISTATFGWPVYDAIVAAPLGTIAVGRMTASQGGFASGTEWAIAGMAAAVPSQPTNRHYRVEWGLIAIPAVQPSGLSYIGVNIRQNGIGGTQVGGMIYPWAAGQQNYIASAYNFAGSIPDAQLSAGGTYAVTIFFSSGTWTMTLGSVFTIDDMGAV